MDIKPKLLLKNNATIYAYDPKAIENAKEVFKNQKRVIFKEHKHDVLNNVDALVLMTEWKEFRSPDFKLLNTKMKRKIIFDGRNQYQNFDFNF